MKKLIILIILFTSNLSFSQIKGMVIDGETREKVPYVNIWIENENIGTTSNEKGEFVLKVDTPKIIVFSAIGFEIKKIRSDSIKSTIELKPAITIFDEVVIKPKNKNEKLTIGKFKKSKLNHYFACGTKPRITARYFEYKKDYDKTSFLDKIRVLTNSDVKDSKFNIRLYGVNAGGEPEGYIYDENIIGIAKKGKKITEIDISDLNIKFPKKGFFLAIEWLIIDSNRYEYNYTMRNSNRKKVGISYEPSIGAVPAETNENSWIFMQGKWRKIWENDNENLKIYKDKYSLMAIELTLTD